MSVENVLSRILEIEHGFQHIIDGTNEIISSNSKEQCFKYAITLLEHKAYQARMLATSILGKLATKVSHPLKHCLFSFTFVCRPPYSLTFNT